MNPIFKNKKGQFFIASAVIIVAVISAVFFFLVQFSQAESSAVITRDDLFFAEGIQREYSKIAELALSNSSRDGSSNEPYLTDSINNFTELVVDLSNQKRMSLSVSTSNNVYTTELVNFTVTATLLSEGRRIDLDFNAVSAMNVTIEQITSDSPCQFDFSVHKEYQEGILGLDGSHFSASINGSACTATFQKIKNGWYNATCLEDCLAGSTVGINVTDNRNIFGESSYST